MRAAVSQRKYPLPQLQTDVLWWETSLILLQFRVVGSAYSRKKESPTYLATTKHPCIRWDALTRPLADLEGRISERASGWLRVLANIIKALKQHSLIAGEQACHNSYRLMRCLQLIFSLVFWGQIRKGWKRKPFTRGCLSLSVFEVYNTGKYTQVSTLLDYTCTLECKTTVLPWLLQQHF